MRIATNRHAKASLVCCHAR